MLPSTLPDLVAYEDLQVRNMVKNSKLSKSISDAAWSNFRSWLEYFGKVFGVVTVAVPPHYTSQNCSKCGKVVKKSLSQIGSSVLSVINFAYQSQKIERLKSLKSLLNKEVRQKG